MLRILGACFVLVVYLQSIDASKVEEKDVCLDKEKTVSLVQNAIGVLKELKEIIPVAEVPSHFEEKILERLVRLEHRIHRMELQKNMVAELESKLEGVVSNMSVQAENISRELKIQQDDAFRVVLTSCRYTQVRYNTGSVITFPEIITAIGITNPSLFTSTGKFTCQVPGVYHISTVITSNRNHLVINIMKNSVKVHHQYITGYTGGHWTPGATVVAIELKTNDTVWIQYASSSGYTTHDSCFTIFKI